MMLLQLVLRYFLGNERTNRGTTILVYSSQYACSRLHRQQDKIRRLSSSVLTTAESSGANRQAHQLVNSQL